MKQTINIRGSEEKQKVGNYQYARSQVLKSSINNLERKSSMKTAIHNSATPIKLTTTKSLEDQIEDSE